MKGFPRLLELILERIKDVVTVSLLENDLALKSGTLFYENWAKPNLTGKVSHVSNPIRNIFHVANLLSLLSILDVEY